MAGAVGNMETKAFVLSSVGINTWLLVASTENNDYE